MNRIEDEKGLDKVKNELNNLNSNYLIEKNSQDQKLGYLVIEVEKIILSFNRLSETVHKLLHFCTL